MTTGPRRVGCQPLAEVAAAFRRCLWFVGRKKTQQDFFTGKATWASKSRSGASGLGGMHFPGTPVAVVTFCSGHRVFTSSGENELPPGPQQTRTGKASLFCTNPRHGLEVPAMARNGGGGGRSRCREVSPGGRRERRKAGPDLEQM